LNGAGLPEEICYLVMEFVEGVSLRQLLNQQKLSPEQALLIVPQICAALEYAHGKGLVHRDIKPENILLTTDSQVKITDFGLARMVHGDGEVARQTLTHTNILMGTPDYMAPEQREKAKSVDHRADIYSLGVIFYEMLTGELPLGRFPVPSKKVSVDVRLDEVILKSLEKEPNMRYQRASHVSKDVADIQNFAPRARQTTVLPDESAVAHEPTLMTLPPEVLQLKDGRRVELSGRGVRVIDSAAPGTAQPAPPFRDGSATYTLALLAMLLALVPFLGVLAMLLGMLFSR
jgi:serine/threonine protein kinase